MDILIMQSHEHDFMLQPMYAMYQPPDRPCFYGIDHVFMKVNGYAHMALTLLYIEKWLSSALKLSCHFSEGMLNWSKWRHSWVYLVLGYILLIWMLSHKTNHAYLLWYGGKYLGFWTIYVHQGIHDDNLFVSHPQFGSHNISLMTWVMLGLPATCKIFVTYKVPGILQFFQVKISNFPGQHCHFPGHNSCQTISFPEMMTMTHHWTLLFHM